MNTKAHDDASTLALVKQLLHESKPREAIALIHRHSSGSLACRNALGVALMRAGEYAKAVEVFRGICVNESGVCINHDLPTFCRTNFATALLLTRRLDGCVSLLKAINREDDAGVRRLRDAIARWRNSLGWVKRIAFDWYGADPDSPVPLDFDPGEVGDASGGALRPAA